MAALYHSKSVLTKARSGCYNPYYLTGNSADVTMRLSTRGEYGVRAMVALARHHGGPPVSLTEIAAAESISLSYLEQLVAALRRAGLVTAVRGASGGYQLARPPAEITIGDVVRPLESVSLTSCTDPDGGRDCCKHRPDCATRDFWRSVNAGLAGIAGQHDAGRPLHRPAHAWRASRAGQSPDGRGRRSG